VLRAHASAEGDVEVADDGAFLDIDTNEDYLRIVGSLHPFIPPR
jgi:CTP:molybdopterin cytidylyltransferase MocA